jgi:hypothetical protein
MLRELTGKISVKKQTSNTSKCGNFVRVDFDFKSLSENSKIKLLKIINQLNSIKEFNVVSTLPEKFYQQNKQLC